MRQWGNQGMLAMVPEIDLDSYNPGSKEAKEMFTRVVGWVKELIIVVRRELLERESIRMDVEVSYIGLGLAPRKGIHPHGCRGLLYRDRVYRNPNSDSNPNP